MLSLHNKPHEVVILSRVIDECSKSLICLQISGNQITSHQEVSVICLLLTNDMFLLCNRKIVSIVFWVYFKYHLYPTERRYFYLIFHDFKHIVGA